MNDFWDQYNHPRWQKKRLEVLNNVDWKCENCGNNEEELNVHHEYYETGLKVWEYDTNFLVALCKRCHTERHEILQSIKELLWHFDNGKLVEIHRYIRKKKR